MKDILIHFLPNADENLLFMCSLAIAAVFFFGGLISLYIGKSLGLLKGTEGNKDIEKILESINLKLDKISGTLEELDKRVSALEVKANKDKGV